MTHGVYIGISTYPYCYVVSKMRRAEATGRWRGLLLLFRGRGRVRSQRGGTGLLVANLIVTRAETAGRWRGRSVPISLAEGSPHSLLDYLIVTRAEPLRADLGLPRAGDHALSEPAHCEQIYAGTCRGSSVIGADPLRADLGLARAGNQAPSEPIRSEGI